MCIRDRYKIDKFAVPLSAKKELLENVNVTHEFLRNLPGFRQDFILEQTSDTSGYNVVTIVEWEDKVAIQNAKNKVHAYHNQIGFSPKKLLESLGVKADLGNYRNAVIE